MNVKLVTNIFEHGQNAPIEAIVDALIQWIDDETYYVFSPCWVDAQETVRCLPEHAQFYTFYIAGEAACDVASQEAAAFLMHKIWQKMNIDVEFDFNITGFCVSSISQACDRLITTSEAPGWHKQNWQSIISAFSSANSNHGCLEMAGRFRSGDDIFAAP